MEIISLFFGIAIGALAVFLLLNSKLQFSKNKNQQLEDSFQEKEKLYKQQIELIGLSKEQMSKDFKSVATDILEKDRANLQTKNSELLTPLQTQLKDS